MVGIRMDRRALIQRLTIFIRVMPANWNALHLSSSLVYSNTSTKMKMSVAMVIGNFGEGWI